MTNVDYQERFKKVAYTKKWAVTMTKVRIRQAVASTPFPRWHLLSFVGPSGSEAKGVVDLIAIRKNHSLPKKGLKRGDAFQLVLIQVKGGSAAQPTKDDGIRLRAVAELHNASGVLLGSWKKGSAAKFYTLRTKAVAGQTDWIDATNLKSIFS